MESLIDNLLKNDIDKRILTFLKLIINEKSYIPTNFYSSFEKSRMFFVNNQLM